MRWRVQGEVEGVERKWAKALRASPGSNKSRVPLLRSSLLAPHCFMTSTQY